jgi:hypothetical protein
VKLGFTYQLISSESAMTTLPIPTGAFGEMPGGEVSAYNYDAHIYSVSAALNPWHRVYLNSTFSYRNSRTWTGHEFTPTVVDYEGELYSSISSVTYVVNEKTDLYASYTYSWADYGENNDPAGLPVGIIYDWHIVSAGVTRRFQKNITTNLQYRFYQYDEDNSGGVNNYTAHGVLAALTVALD